MRYIFSCECISVSPRFSTISVSDILPVFPSLAGAVLRGAGRHVRAEGAAPGARHRPGRRWRQLLRHRKVRGAHIWLGQ